MLSYDISKSKFKMKQMIGHQSVPDAEMTNSSAEAILTVSTLEGNVIVIMIALMVLMKLSVQVHFVTLQNLRIKSCVIRKGRSWSN